MKKQKKEYSRFIGDSTYHFDWPEFFKDNPEHFRHEQKKVDKFFEKYGEKK